MNPAAVDTTGNVADLPLASIGRRVGAVAIDMTIGFVVTFSILSLMVQAAASAARAGDADGYRAIVTMLYLVSFLVSLGWWLLLSVLQTNRGSPGQRLLGVRLRSAGSGEPLGVGAAFGRNLLFALLAGFIVGYFTPLFDTRRRQGWHDKAVGAVMVDARDVPAGVPAVAAADTADPPSAEPSAVEPSVGPAAASTPSTAGAEQALPAVLAGSGVISRTPFAPSDTQSPLPSPPARGTEGSASHDPSPLPAAGLVSAVPGFTRPHVEDGRTVWAVPPVGSAAPPAPAPAPAPPASSIDAPATPGPPVDEDDIDLTRHVPPGSARSAVTVVWDDGTRTTVSGPTLFGRNPDPAEGYAIVAVVDDTRSLSKTHFELDAEGRRLWLVDRHSTNGTSIDAPGSPRRTVVPGERTAVGPGDTVVIGDRTFTFQVVE